MFSQSLIVSDFFLNKKDAGRKKGSFGVEDNVSKDQ